ncbi:hypothetical protein [Neorhizobium huautlense]|jgi:hypothetical protein|uniref:hypothetical protein n=1 Tax=Neorhizobium huautlense TaxID=67774 RepID=UPI000DDAAC36|nr:hypothetical protein [Neorhizobium huautlense]
MSVSKEWDFLKKMGRRISPGPVSCEGQNLQRGTAGADDGEVADGVSCQLYGEVISARQDAIFGFGEKFLSVASCRAHGAAGQKKRATGSLQGPISVKVKNLQRGTAAAVELGGKATMCISCVRYGGFLCSEQCSFVQVSHA